MTSAPPPPSIVSLPEPVVIVLAAAEPVTRQRGRERGGIEVFEIADADAVAGGLVGAGATAKLTAVMPPRAAMTSVSEPEPPSIEASVP